MNQIAMSVPGASLMNGMSLTDQVAGETAEMRRKRLQNMKSAQQLPSGFSSLADGYGSAMSAS
jgi:hypothetical protein